MKIELNLPLHEGMKWKQYPYDKSYLVSSKGDIFSLKRMQFSSKTLSNSGYINYYLGKTRQWVGAHRAVYETFIGKIGEGLQINHINWDRQDNSLSNLEVVTSSENLLRRRIK